jgi:DNA replicative helicase MCM subunit Mcm2 (Cdc46/Mcm family)
VSQDFLKDFIYYCRHHSEPSPPSPSLLPSVSESLSLVTLVAPEISDEAVDALVEVSAPSSCPSHSGIQGYLSMRSLGGRGSKTITATPRQLESMIRISQALAKMRMSSIVTASDVYESIRLMKVATQTAATDPRTGTIDMDMITTGRSGIDRELVLKLADQVCVPVFLLTL